MQGSIPTTAVSSDTPFLVTNTSFLVLDGRLSLKTIFSFQRTLKSRVKNLQKRPELLNLALREQFSSGYLLLYHWALERLEMVQ